MDFYWDVKGSKFYNIYLAYDRAKELGIDWGEVCFTTDLEPYRQALADLTEEDLEQDSDYDTIRWLYDDHGTAPIGLFYSGGSDSHTILTKIMELNLDVFCYVRSTSDSMTSAADEEVAYATKFLDAHGIPYDVQTVGVDNSKHAWADESMKLTVYHPDYTQMPAFRRHFPLHQRYKNLHWMINGADKPRIIKFEGRWYATLVDIGMMDHVYRKYNAVIPFFLHPYNIGNFVRRARILTKYAKDFQRVLNVNDLSEEDRKKVFDEWGYRTSEHIPNLGKSFSDGIVNHKDRLAIREVLAEGENTVAVMNFFSCMKKLTEKYPEWKGEIHPPGHFGPCIDLETLEIINHAELQSGDHGNHIRHRTGYGKIVPRVHTDQS